MMLNAHADSVDKNCNHNALAEVFALHNSPEFPPHIIPHVFTLSKACPLSLPFSAILLLADLLAHLFYCIILIFLPICRVSRSPRPLCQGTYRAVISVLRNSQTDGIGHWLGTVVWLALMWTVGCWTDAQKRTDDKTVAALSYQLQIFL